MTPDNVNILIAFGGGIVSVLSPCVLPLLPGYLSVITGLSVGEVREGDTKTLSRIAVTTLWFAVGFTVVFVLLGLLASGIGQTVFRNQVMLTRISGVVVILLAVFLAASQFAKVPVALYGEARVRVDPDRFGPFAAPVVGAAFAFGWTPCLGPVIAAVFAVAATQTTVRAVALLTAYSAGMAVSFLAVGLAFGRWAAPLDWVKRHMRAITLVSAAILLVFGILLLTDELWRLSARLVSLLDRLGLDSIVTVG